MTPRTPVGASDGKASCRHVAVANRLGGLLLLGATLACGAPEASAPAAPKPAASAPAPAPTPPPVDLRGGAGGTGEAVYPTPVEVTGCLDLVAAGETERAAAVCARAHQLEPGNADVRAANAKLQGE
jgi:hypothetical protein